MELELLDDGLVLGTINVEVDYIHMGRIDYLTQLGCRCTEGECLGQTVFTLLLTIQITGHETLLAKQLRGFLARVGALLTVYANFFHNLAVLL
jgi:hypothetical protein